jgi:hypothetical protein
MKLSKKFIAILLSASVSVTMASVSLSASAASSSSASTATSSNSASAVNTAVSSGINGIVASLNAVLFGKTTILVTDKKGTVNNGASIAASDVSNYLVEVYAGHNSAMLFSVNNTRWVKTGNYSSFGNAYIALKSGDKITITSTDCVTKVKTTFTFSVK